MAKQGFQGKPVPHFESKRGPALDSSAAHPFFEGFCVLTAFSHDAIYAYHGGVRI